MGIYKWRGHLNRATVFAHAENVEKLIVTVLFKPRPKRRIILNISFKANLTELINQPQAFSYKSENVNVPKPSIVKENTEKSSIKLEEQPSAKILHHHKMAKRHVQEAFLSAVFLTSCAVVLFAGKGNFKNGFKKLFGKPLKEKTIPTEVKADINALKNDIINNPKNHEDFIINLLNKFKISKWGDLTPKIENETIEASNVFSETERRK